MKSLFKAEFFTANRNALQRQADCDLIIVPANGLLQRGADSAYPFQQDANFWYLTGINEPDLLLVMQARRHFLIVPARSDSRKAFDGSVSLDALRSRSGISLIFEGDAGKEALHAALQQASAAAVMEPAPEYIDQLGLYTNPARRHVITKLKREFPRLVTKNIAPILRSMRTIKQPQELAAIERAIAVTIAGLESISQTAASMPYKYEYEIEADLSRSFRSRGASGHSFDPIVAAGKRACTLHYVENSGSLSIDDLVVIDVGAEVEHYAADITRTLCFAKPTDRQRAVYDAVLEVHAYALSLLKPGVYLKEYELQVQEYMAKHLRELGLITGNDTQNVRRYYPHATSHFLGLNVHDVGDYDKPLSANMVLTVEPGIYIPEEGIGVRIEDDVLITDSANRVLSDKLSREL